MVILGGLRPPLATRQAQDEEKDLKLLTLTLSLSKGEGRPKAAKGEAGRSHFINSLLKGQPRAAALVEGIIASRGARTSPEKQAKSAPTA